MTCLFMVTGVFGFYPTFRFIIPNKDERKDALCALDHSSNARGRFRDNRGCRTSQGKKRNMRLGEQKSCTVKLVESWSCSCNEIEVL